MHLLNLNILINYSNKYIETPAEIITANAHDAINEKTYFTSRQMLNSSLTSTVHGWRNNVHSCTHRGLPHQADWQAKDGHHCNAGHRSLLPGPQSLREVLPAFDGLLLRPLDLPSREKRLAARLFLRAGFVHWL